MSHKPEWATEREHVLIAASVLKKGGTDVECDNPENCTRETCPLFKNGELIL